MLEADSFFSCGSDCSFSQILLEFLLIISHSSWSRQSADNVLDTIPDSSLLLQ
jgi:hypothetical protein